MTNVTPSPMNYMGSKYKLLPLLLELFPENINTFVDLFCGSCVVGLNVDSKVTVFNDNLVYLIDLYEKFKTLSEKEILVHIENRIKEYKLSLTNKDGFLAVRKLYNTERNPLDLFVLLSYSFTHQIRFNNAHEFNQSFGLNSSHFNEHQKANLLQFLKKLKEKETVFSRVNFDEFNYDALTKDDFVYCDPPYLITAASYNDGKRGFTGWNENHEKKLLAILDSLNKRGIRFALSNVLKHKDRENVILNEWLSKRDYKVHRFDKLYCIRRTEKALKPSQEVLITNY